MYIFFRGKKSKFLDPLLTKTSLTLQIQQTHIVFKSKYSE